MLASANSHRVKKNGGNGLYSPCGVLGVPGGVLGVPARPSARPSARACGAVHVVNRVVPCPVLDNRSGL